MCYGHVYGLQIQNLILIIRRKPKAITVQQIWAQGARAGDPLLVCEPLNAGLPPKKHLRDLTHRERVALFFLIVSKDRAVDATRLSLAARSLMNTARCADH